MVPRRVTGATNYASERFAALAAQGITGDVARAIVAHWSFETGGGNGEWNFNVANRKANAGEKAVDLGAAGIFKAYDTLDDGVREYLALLRSSRYVECWNVLQSNPRTNLWIRCLGLKGYYEEPIDQYLLGYSRVLLSLPIS
jgi:hypothetical protein